MVWHGEEQGLRAGCVSFGGAWLVLSGGVVVERDGEEWGVGMLGWYGGFFLGKGSVFVVLDGTVMGE